MRAFRRTTPALAAIFAAFVREFISTRTTTQGARTRKIKTIKLIENINTP
ncbi:hypothetical protein [Pantoea sp. 18069]|nr:hypothetical protein [Pantoea sp. 18069]